MREIGVVWSGTDQVEDNNDVEGKHTDGQVPAVEQWGHTGIHKDTGDGGGVEKEGSSHRFGRNKLCLYTCFPRIVLH